MQAQPIAYTSWIEPVPGNNGPCYMKGAVGSIQQTKEVTGGRKISGCVKLRLKRKRVVHVAPERNLAKRAGIAVAPDFIFTKATNTVTATTTIVAASYTLVYS